MAGCVEALCLECCAMLLSVLYFLSGVACVILGIFVTAGDITNDLKHININKPFAVLTLSSLIVAGTFFLLGFFGIAVHLIKKPKLGLFYNSLVLFVSLLIFVASFVLISVGKTELINRFGNETVASMSYYGKDEMLTDTWNTWQSKLLCCGYNNQTDWIKNNLSIPNTCCRDIYIGCVEFAIPESDDVHQEGCKENFVRSIKDFVNGLFIVVIVYSNILILMMLATLCTLCDCCKPTSEQEVNKPSTPI